MYIFSCSVSEENLRKEGSMDVLRPEGDDDGERLVSVGTSFRRL